MRLYREQAQADWRDDSSTFGFNLNSDSKSISFPFTSSCSDHSTVTDWECRSMLDTTAE